MYLCILPLFRGVYYLQLPQPWPKLSDPTPTATNSDKAFTTSHHSIPQRPPIRPAQDIKLHLTIIHIPLDKDCQFPFRGLTLLASLPQLQLDRIETSFELGGFEFVALFAAGETFEWCFCDGVFVFEGGVE